MKHGSRLIQNAENTEQGAAPNGYPWRAWTLCHKARSDAEMTTTSVEAQRMRPVALLLIAASAIIGGTLIGASTNAINGVISPDYFRSIMRWDDVDDIWRAGVAQGIFEGLIYGLLFSLIFTLVVGVVSRARCSFTFALRYLLAIIAAIYVCWAVGGIIAMGLAALSPDFYRHTFVGVPDDFGLMMRYAWVGGSIWSAMFGGVLAAVIGSILFATRWRRSHADIAT